MSKAVSASTKVPASETPESVLLVAPPHPLATAPLVETSLANGSWNIPLALIKLLLVVAPDADIAALPPNA